jgi:hypothetical protein
MPAISPRRYDSTVSPDVQFSDEYGNYVELVLDGGPEAVTESADRPSTLLKGNAGGKFGDFDTNFSHIEQGTFDGGFGQETYEDTTRFLDDYEMWTLTPDHAHNSLLRQWATGIRSTDTFWPSHDFRWVPLYGNAYWINTPFPASASYSSAQVYIWLRRVGNPGSITVDLCPDSSGVPGTAAKTKTLTIDDVKPGDAKPVCFEWATVESLTSGTTYHLNVYSAAPYSDVNHWEVGCGTCPVSAQPSRISTDGAAYSNTSFKMFFRSTDADTQRKMHFFIMEGCLYMVDEKLNSGNSVFYINGDRGIADANTGALTTLVDASRSWTVNEYAGYRVKVIGGTGTGEHRLVISNTATALTVDSAWTTEQDTTTRYVIYGGPKWTAVTLTGTALTGRVTSASVSGPQVFMSRGMGTSQYIMRAKNLASDATHSGAADSTNQADYVMGCYDTTDNNNIIVRAENSGTNAVKVSTGTAPAWGANTTFGTAKSVGESNFTITNLGYYDDKIIIAKEDGLWGMKGGKPRSLDMGFDAYPSLNNGKVLFRKNFYLYTNWSNSMEMYYGTTVDDFGPAFRGAGIPSNRKGYFSSGTAPIGWQFYSINGGSGFSSVWAYNGRGWHEIMRGLEAGKNIFDIFWQPVEGGNNILWINYGGDLLYLVFPNDELNPLKDETLLYEPVGELSLSRMDMGMIQIPKYIKDCDIISDNLGGGDFYSLEYQVDGEIGTEYHRQAGDAHESPVAKVPIQESGIRSVSFNIRSFANDLHRPPVLRGFVAKMFGRAPYTRAWQMRVSVVETNRNGTNVPWFKLHEVYQWLSSTSKSASGLTMHCYIPEMDDVNVIIEPPNIIRDWVRQLIWGGSIILTVREVG